jgi:hypothetical protein
MLSTGLTNTVRLHAMAEPLRLLIAPSLPVRNAALHTNKILQRRLSINPVALLPKRSLAADWDAFAVIPFEYGVPSPACVVRWFNVRPH